ncbi:MAG: hypothetical protein BVN35_17645 [Proteobacteria bacterium ST_bin11]|nr:MAG: hypothetical protein BVN35_17645 [Proteobacteria bacterium ST_bin11]
MNWRANTLRFAKYRLAFILHTVGILWTFVSNAHANTKYASVVARAHAIVIASHVAQWSEDAAEKRVATILRAIVVIVAVELKDRRAYSVARTIFFAVTEVSI